MNTIQNFNSILEVFNIKAQCINHQQIENYSYFDLRLKTNTKIKDVEKYMSEFALALRSPGKPTIKLIHDEGLVRLEFVTPRTSALNLFDYFTNDGVPEGDLVCLLGQTLQGEKLWMDLADNPHMIVAGSTGSGKSTLLHNIIGNIFNYNNADLYLIDPKNIEFALYHKNGMNVSFTYDEALALVDQLLLTMEERFTMIRSGYEKAELPYIVLIIDEFADLIMQDENKLFYNKLTRLAQKCRAARISIILATQRPSVDIVSGSIKANFPARIACRVATHVDSKVILDAVGAENLMGKGDALVRDNKRFLERFQIAYTSAEEVCTYFGQQS